MLFYLYIDIIFSSKVKCKNIQSTTFNKHNKIESEDIDMQIHFKRNFEKEPELKLLPYDSELWNNYRSASKSILELLKELMKNPDNMDKFKNLCDNLCHQLSFYSGTYPVMPYLVSLFNNEKIKEDFKRQLAMFSEIGIIILTDIPAMNGEIHDSNDEVFNNYNTSILILQDKLKNFIEENIDNLTELDADELSQFYIASLAILGDREIAYLLCMSLPDNCYVVCKNCEYCDEEMEEIMEEKPENITPAENVIGKWDGTSVVDTYIWFSNFVHILGDETETELLAYYFGTYTCPECGAKTPVIDLMKNYYFEEL